MCSSVRTSFCGSSFGASTGCSVKRTCSRMMSAGGRSIHGTSARTPRQVLLMRHSSVGSQVKPDSMQTSFSFGNFWNTPSAMKLTSWFSKLPPCTT